MWDRESTRNQMFRNFIGASSTISLCCMSGACYNHTRVWCSIVRLGSRQWLFFGVRKPKGLPIESLHLVCGLYSGLCMRPNPTSLSAVQPMTNPSVLPSSRVASQKTADADHGPRRAHYESGRRRRGLGSVSAFLFVWNRILTPVRTAQFNTILNEPPVIITQMRVNTCLT